MNWAIVIPVGIGIAVLLSIALIAIDVSGQISRKEEADEVEFYFAKEFAQTTPSSHIPPYQDVSKMLYNRERQHDSWGTCIDLVHAIEHQQWLDAPEGKKEAPGTTYRSHGPVPLGREPYPKIEKVEE